MATDTNNLIHQKSISENDAEEIATKVEHVISEEEAAKENIGTQADMNGKEEIQKKIIKQVEYYFGNFNLPRDKFLLGQTKVNDGWVSLDTMVKFKRLSELSVDHEVIRNALKGSQLMEVDDDSDCIRRSPGNPLPYFGEDLKAESIKRTIYCKGFPKDGSVNLDILLKHFKPYGPFENIHMRQFYDKKTKNSGFKGSILIVFSTVEKAQAFLDVDDIQFKGKPLICKWQRDYLEEKTQEYNERKARKEAKLEKVEKGSNAEGEDQVVENVSSEVETIPSGTFIFLSGFPTTTTREDIKAALANFTDDIAFVDFSKGDTEGYIRLGTAYSNEDLVEKVKDKFEVNGASIEVRVVEGDEEEQQIEKAKEARSKMIALRGKKRKSRGGRGFGRFNKRRKY